MKIKLLLLLFPLFLTACGGQPRSEESGSSPASRDVISQKESTADADNKAGSVSGQSANTSATSQVSLEKTDNSATKPATTERKIIRNADLVLETVSPEEVQTKIASLVDSQKGFVVETFQQGGVSANEQRNAVNMTVRVPAEKFEETLKEIRQIASRVISENVKGQDVTEEFIDIEARLKTKLALEAQYLEILKKAVNVEEILSVRREIANVRQEIEQIEGRKRFLENQSSFSTIKLRLQPPNYFSPNSAGFFYRLREAVSNGFNGALGFVLFFIQAIITLLPFFLLIVLPIYLLIRYFWRKRRAKNSTVEEKLE